MQRKLAGQEPAEICVALFAMMSEEPGAYYETMLLAYLYDKMFHGMKICDILLVKKTGI